MFAKPAAPLKIAEPVIKTVDDELLMGGIMDDIKADTLADLRAKKSKGGALNNGFRPKPKIEVLDFLE